MPSDRAILHKARSPREVEDGRPSDRRGTAAAPRAQPLQAINGLRGPGALAIAFGHLGVATDLVSYRHLEPLALFVDFFFVLSGLVIAQAYAAKLGRPAAIPSYVIRRIGRIWPVQAATLAILVAYELVKVLLQLLAAKQFTSPPFDQTGINLLRAIPTNLLLIQSLGIHDRETWNFPSWSISVEAVTYVLFAAFCLLTPRLRRAFALMTIVLSLAVLCAVAPFHMRSTFDYGVFRCLSGFFAGTLCHDIIAGRRLPRPPMPTVVELAVFGATCVWLVYSTGTYATYAAPFVYSILVLSFVDGRGLLSRLLSSKPAQVLAEWSFAIYMVHAIVLILCLAAIHQIARVVGGDFFTLIRNPVADHPGARPMIEVLHLTSAPAIVLVALVYATGVLVAAWLAYRYVEVPGRALFARLGRRFDPRVSGSVPAEVERADAVIGGHALAQPREAGDA